VNDNKRPTIPDGSWPSADAVLDDHVDLGAARHASDSRKTLTRELDGLPPVLPESEETIAVILSQLATSAGYRLAVDDGERRLTYRELAEKVAHLALRIDALVPLGRPVGVVLPVTADFIVAILAVLVGGRPYVPLDPSFPSMQHRRITEHADLAAVLVDDAGSQIIMDAVPDLLRIMVSEPPTPGSVSPEMPVRTKPNDLAAIYYTSGSTGQPKGVMYDQGTLVRVTRDLIETLSIVPTDRISMVYRPSGIAGGRDIFGALLSGACLCIVDLKRFGANETRRRLAAHRVTICHCPPPVFRTLFGEDSAVTEPLASARIIWLMGDRVVPSDLDLFYRRFTGKCRLYVGIATTETLTYASWWVDPDIAVANDLVAVGRPLSESALRLIDDAGCPVPPGMAGEIVVTTTSSARGYWGDEERTRTRFRPSETAAGAIDYHTGDVGRFRPDGLLDFLGRKDRQVKIRGNTVHPDAVEAIIAIMPDIAKIAIVVRQQAFDASLIAYCVGTSRNVTTLQAIRAWCTERLPSFMCPADIVLTDSLPTLANGKIDYASLKEWDCQRFVKASPTPLAPASRLAVTGIVRDVWEHFLPGTFDFDRSFSESGGNSLLALKLFALLEKRTGRTLPLTLLTNSVSPSDLIVALKAELEQAPPSQGTAKPALFFFTGLYGQGMDIVSSEFGRQLSGHFDVRIIDYRIAGDELRGDFEPARLFTAVTQEMEQAGKLGPLWVIGISFGAKIAAEAARLVMPRGTVIERLINIDGRASESVLKPFSRPRRIDKMREWGFGRWFVLHLINRLVRRGRLRMARTLLATLDRIGLTSIHERAHRVAIGWLRQQAFKSIPGGGLSVPMILLRSDDGRHDLERYPDLGWRQYCADVEVRMLGGSHLELIRQVERLTTEVLLLR